MKNFNKLMLALMVVGSMNSSIEATVNQIFGTPQSCPAGQVNTKFQDVGFACCPSCSSGLTVGDGEYLSCACVDENSYNSCMNDQHKKSVHDCITRSNLSKSTRNSNLTKEEQDYKEYIKKMQKH